MYVSEQMDLLDGRLEDPNRTKFIEAVRLKALRNSELKLIAHLHNSYLTELQAAAEGVMVTGGKISLEGLPKIAIRGAKGVEKVRVHDGRWCTEIDFKDIKQWESPLYRGNIMVPQYCVYGNQIWFDPPTVARADVYYLRMPSPLLGTLMHVASAPSSNTTFAGSAGQGLNESTANYYVGAVIRSFQTPESVHVVTAYEETTRTFTVSPAKSGGNFGMSTFSFVNDPFTTTRLDGVESELNPSLHELEVSLAEAECWASSRAFDRRDSVLKSAFEEIAVLNGRVEAAEGIGTRGGK